MQLISMLWFFLPAMIVTSACYAMAQDVITGPLKPDQDNPRYFSDSDGKVVYLTGSHVWDNLQDWGGDKPDFDFISYLDFLKKNNHNFIRLWVGGPRIAQNGKVYRANQMPWPRTGPGSGNNGELKFDLTKFREEYFTRLRSRIEEAGKRGIYVSVMLFNGLSDWKGHPFNIENNINRINGDSDKNGNGDEVYTLKDPRILSLQESYVRKVVDTVNDLDNVLFEVGNEIKKHSLRWQYNMINYIHDYEKTKQKKHPVGMTSTGGNSGNDLTNTDLLNSPADWISPGSAEPGQNYSYNPPPATGGKVIISDTDHLWGVLSEPTPEWVWRSFLRGLNPIVMDVLQNTAPDIQYKWNDPKRPELARVRTAMGQTFRYAGRIGLKKMVPRTEIASTQYCLANPGYEYLIYQPITDIRRRDRIIESLGILTRKIWVDLYGVSGSCSVEWFNPNTDEVLRGGIVEGGSVRFFDVPFSGDAILYLYRS